MSDKNSSMMVVAGCVMTALISGVVAMVFIGPQQSQKNRANQIDQLPAMQEKLASVASTTTSIKGDIETLRNSQNSAYASLRDAISEIQRIQAKQLDRGALDDAFQSLRNALEDLEGQLNRRIQLEVKDPIYAELADLKASIDALDVDSEDNENKISEISEKVSGLTAMVEMAIKESE